MCGCHSRRKAKFAPEIQRSKADTLKHYPKQNCCFIAVSHILIHIYMYYILKENIKIEKETLLKIIQQMEKLVL